MRHSFDSPLTLAPAPHLAAPYRARPASREPADVAAGHERLLYVDWLRFLCLAGVFVIHIAEVFNPWDEWHITDAARSRVVGEVVVLMAPWIMPLFMLLAGVSAWYSLERRTDRQFLIERVTRVLLPLVVGTLLLVPPQVWLERRLRGQFDGSLLAFYPRFFEGIYPRGNFSWHHLWFLGHLFLYSVIALPLLRLARRARGRRAMARLARWCGGPIGLLWLALPLVLERHLLWWLFPERMMLTSDWSNHALLFVAYLYGFVLAGEPLLGARIDAQWPNALAVAAVTTSVLVVGTWVGVLPDGLPPPYSALYLAFWTMYAVGAWAWMVALLGAGRRMLTRDAAPLRHSRRSGYAWYLLHQTAIVAVAFHLVQWQAPLWWKVPTLTAISLVLTLGAAELLGRWAPARWAMGLRAREGS